MVLKVNKNIFRLFVAIISAILIFAILNLCFSYQETINDNLSFCIPSALYISNNKKLSFDYPDILKAYSQNYSGGEIVYHVDLINETNGTHAYVQVQRLSESLYAFLEKAKAAFSASVHNFKEIFPISGNIDVREWEYDVGDTPSKETHVRQYFSMQGNDLIIVSLFAPKNEWSKSQDSMYNEIKDSVTLIS